MRVGRVVRLLMAVAMLALGTLLALAGMGYLGESASQSGTWSILGSVLAGLGVALALTELQRRSR